MIARERRRLRAAFGAALLSVAAPYAIQACYAGSGAPLGPDGSVPDASNDHADQTADVGADDLRTGDAREAGGGGDAADDSQACAPDFRLDAAYSDAPADAQICGVTLPCGLPSNLSTSGCTVLDSPDGSPIGCQIDDDGGCASTGYQPGDAQVALQCYCDIFVGGGRRPRGSRERPRVRATTALGAYLATVAGEEAASIRAFDELRADLIAFGAPGELPLAAARAAKDEVRHARVMSRLARAFGAEAPRLSASSRRPRRARDLEAIARANTVEGCVRETYAALLARWQALHAETPILRRAFARIAEDETRHAALAWAVARWADSRLDARARSRVARARRLAVQKLHRELSTDVPHAMTCAAGLPDSRTAVALLAALALELRA